MARLAILLLAVLLLTTAAHAAVAAADTAVAVPIGEASGEAVVKGNLKIDEIPHNVRVLSAERTEGHVKLRLSVELPNPCYSIRTRYRAVQEDEGYEVKFYLNLVESNAICPQVVQYIDLNADLNVPGDAPVKLYIESEREFYGDEEEYGYESDEYVEIYSPVPYEKRLENNTLTLTFKGCYDYSVEPLRCPNCYVIYLEQNGDCNSTTVTLNLSPGIKGEVKVLLRNEYQHRYQYEYQYEYCEKIGEVAREYNAVLGKMVADACAQGDINRACEILKEHNVPGAAVVCAVKEGNVPVMAGISGLIEEVKKYAPEVARELEVMYREGRFWDMREKVCEVLEEKNEVLYKKVCEGEANEWMRKEMEEQVRERVRKIGEANNTEELRREIQRLRQEIERYRKEIKELRLKIEELRRKILVTPRGIIDVETNQEINVPRVAIEVKVKNKPVVVKKEENTVAIEVNGPVRVMAKVKAPVEVEENAILVNGKPVKVLPDEVIQKIQERLRAQEVEDVELEEEDNKPVYRVRVRTEGRLLFLIPVEVPAEVYVDAETGSEVKVQKPWWAFLVFG